MQVCYAGLRGRSSQSSTTVRTTRLPLPDNLGFGSFWLGSAAIVRWVRLAGRRVRLDGLQPIVGTFHRATDLGWVVRRANEPLDRSRDFRRGVAR